MLPFQETTPITYTQIYGVGSQLLFQKFCVDVLHLQHPFPTHLLPPVSSLLLSLTHYFLFLTHYTYYFLSNSWPLVNYCYRNTCIYTQINIKLLSSESTQLYSCVFLGMTIIRYKTTNYGVHPWGRWIFHLKSLIVCSSLSRRRVCSCCCSKILGHSSDRQTMQSSFVLAGSNSPSFTLTHSTSF